MSVIFFLLPLALGIAALGLIGFAWALRDGQFDDLEGARWRILFEDHAGTVAPVESGSVAGSADHPPARMDPHHDPR